MTSGSIIHTDLHKPNNKLVSAQLEHFWCTNEPWANTNSQYSPWLELGGTHHLPPYSILCAQPRGQHPNVILSLDSHLRLLKVRTFVILKAHNFVCKPSINVRFKEKLQLLSRAFQQYVACHLHASKLGRFVTPDPSFGHNLYFKYSNGSYKPILDI